MRLSLTVLVVSLFIARNASAQVLSDEEVLQGIRTLSVWTNVAPVDTVESYVNLYNLRASIENRLRQFRITPVAKSDYVLRLNIIIDKVRGGAYYVVRLDIRRPVLVRTGAGSDTYADTSVVVYDDARFGSAGDSSIGDTVVEASNNLTSDFLAQHALANSKYTGPPLVPTSNGDLVGGLRGAKDIKFVFASVERGFEGSITSDSAEDFARSELSRAGLLTEDVSAVGVMNIRVSGLRTNRGVLYLIQVDVTRLCSLLYAQKNRVAEGTVWRGFSTVQPGGGLFDPTVRDEIRTLIGMFLDEHRKENSK